MKLTDITEGTFGNLMSMAAAKIGSNPDDRLIVKADQKLFALVQKAKTYRFHLFDSRAIPWWKAVFDYFDVPQNLRMEVLVAARSEFYDRLDHSLFEADISKIADFLNPRTREGTAKTSARAAVTEKLATAVIGYVSRAAAQISPAEREAAVKDKADPLSPPDEPKERQPEGKPPRVTKWKKMPDEKTIEQALILAKAAVRESGTEPSERRYYLQELDKMGFRIEWSDPPKLRLKR